MQILINFVFARITAKVKLPEGSRWPQKEAVRKQLIPETQSPNLGSVLKAGLRPGVRAGTGPAAHGGCTLVSQALARIQ